MRRFFSRKEKESMRIFSKLMGQHAKAAFRIIKRKPKAKEVSND